MLRDTYVFLGILDALLDLGYKLLQNPVPIAYCWQPRVDIEVKHVSVDPGLYVSVS